MLPVDADATPPEPPDLLSALVDGEVDRHLLERGCRAWADDGDAARRTWHAYHLIGDVLRCEDLSSAPERDAAFLQRLRAQLALEPAQPNAGLPAASGNVHPFRRRLPRVSWGVPAALAAGIAALGTVVVLSRLPQPGAEPALAAAAPASATLADASLIRQSPAPQVLELGDQLIRSARLDRYLRAHRDYGGMQPASLPGGIGRGIETVSFER